MYKYVMAVYFLIVFSSKGRHLGREVESPDTICNLCQPSDLLYLVSVDTIVSEGYVFTHTCTHTTSNHTKLSHAIRSAGFRKLIGK